GVGKNMVSSIKYWLRACQLVDAQTGQPTEVGEMVFGEKKGFDPYLEDEATIWLVHWLLASNPTQATSWYWFFNKFHKPVFTSSELVTALADWTREVILDGRRPSMSTIKNDAQLLHRMYTQSKGNTRMPLEEALDSPLSLLRLVTQSAGGRAFHSRLEARTGLPLGIFGFAVLSLMQARGASSLPLEELMYARDHYPAPGAVFRLTENDLITKLEQLAMSLPGKVEIRETAGIHQIYMLDDIAPTSLLKSHYQNSMKGVAA
ncbi:MAG: DUF4007 family protein, partial [Endozoicomonas sp.]